MNDGARRLRRYLADTGLTRKQFGQWLQPSVTERTVQRWLSGQQYPTVPQMISIYNRTKHAITPNNWAGIRDPQPAPVDDRQRVDDAPVMGPPAPRRRDAMQ